MLLHLDSFKSKIMRRNKLYYIFLCLFLLAQVAVVAQNGKVKKANKDFDRYKFIDAREIYLKVVEDGYASAQIYQQLGDTFYWNSDYDNAAKWYAKLISEFPGEAETIYFYRASLAHKSIEKTSESERYMSMYLDRGGDPGILKASQTKLINYEVSLSKASVNSEYSDFSPSFYQNMVVFASSKTGSTGDKVHAWMEQPFTDLYLGTVNSEGDITSSTPLGGDVNTRYHETTPTFTKDGKTMYFTRNNFIDGKKGRDKDKTLHLKIYKATSVGNNTWGNIVELPFNNEEYSVAHPTLSADEKRLYFAAEIPGGYGMSDLWYVDINGENQYGEPVNLGPNINTEARESFPFISSENELYFSSDGRGGLGGFDVFKVSLDESDAEVSNLGEPTNSIKDDFGFIINDETRIGYVSSNRGGTEGSIDDDIYLVKEICKIQLAGKVYDIDTGEPIPAANVTISDESNNLVDTAVVGADGMYSFELDCDQKYTLRASKSNYTPFEKLIATPDKTSELTVDAPLKIIDPCPENDLGCKLTLLPIYFDFDKWNIRPDAEIELAKILAAMRQYPSLVIHIESHTDSRANNAYNIRLSERRAQSTLNWLVSKGIDKSRLTAKGYGETQLVNECADGVPCTEEAHQLNRRSMFIIQPPKN